MLETTISELRNRISALDSASSDASALRPEAARLQRELDGARAEARDCRDRSGRLEEDLSRMQSKLDSSARDHEAQKNRLEEQVSCFEVFDCLDVTTSFSNSGEVFGCQGGNYSETSF